MVLLDRDEDDILRAVETGALRWAWDIATAGAARRELRIWRGSLISLMERKAEPDQDEARVIDDFLPHRDVRTTELQRWFSCSSTHVHALLDLHIMRESAPATASSGPRSYSLIERGSVVRFLTARRVA